jgi:hypothetical protein
MLMVTQQIGTTTAAEGMSEKNKNKKDKEKKKKSKSE